MPPYTSRKSGLVIAEPNPLADAVKMMLKHFLKMRSTRKTSTRSGCLVIDIELRVKRDFYTELCSMVKNGLLPKSDPVIAYILTRNSGEGNEISYEIRNGEGDFEIRKIISNNGFISFPSFRNYALINLQYKLPSRYFSEFKNILITEFNRLKESHDNVKITFYFGKEVFYTNHVTSDDDFQDCRSFSLPLIAVIRQTMNTGFRDRCFERLRVDNINDAEKILEKTLFSIIHENYMVP